MKTENNLDTDNVKQLVRNLAIPSMLAQFVNVLYSIVDRMYIGNIPEIGSVALAGVGVCGPIVTMIASVAFLVGIGGAPLMSIRLGEKNERAAAEILANCFLMLVVLSGTITVAAMLLRSNMLWWFGAGEATFIHAYQYLSVYLMGTVFALLSTGMNQFIICQGFAKVGMKTVLAGAVSNIVLDPIFIFGLGMGVQGAALATVLSQIVSCSFVLAFLFGKKIPIRITFSGYDKAVMMRVLSIGVTPFLISAFDNILIISLNAVIQRYGGALMGDSLLVCATIVQSFMLMVTMPLAGITGGTQTILGYNYGAKRPDRILEAEKAILKIGLIFTAVMFVAAHTVSGLFVRIFTQNPGYIELSVWAIKVYTLGIIPLAAQYMVVDGFTGMGISRVAIILSMFRKAVFFLGVFLIPPIWGVEQVFFTEPLSDFIGTAVSVAVFLAVFSRIQKRMLSEQTQEG